jgi:hypothetical protein
VTPGVFTWNELSGLDGNVLFVINSDEWDTDAVNALFASFELHLPRSVVHVIATRDWQPYLAQRGVASDRILVALDDEGRDVELNHFLATPAVILWTVQKQFAAIVGSEIHNLYNEEVKDIFEQRALLLLGDGCLLAHTLPLEFVYVFGVPEILERCGRDVKIRDYEREARSLVDALHRVWQAAGRPATTDNPDYSDVLDVLARRMGPPLLAYDEVSPIPIAPPAITGALAAVVAHHRAVVSEHDRQLQAMTALHAERSDAVEVREQMLAELSAERVAAVNVRDKIIDDLRLELEPFHRKLRRRWAERRQ